MLKKIDWYIIKKFLGTYFFSIVLILSIAIVFDITEKMDDFFESQAPLKAIIFQYYLNFIPYYTNMFSQLFIFISVIFFTSKLAGNSEFIAMLASGMSFRRIMLPYLFSSTCLFALIFLLAGYVIPPANGRLLDFENQYVSQFKTDHQRNIQMEVEPGSILYIESFQLRTNSGYRASLEHFEGKTLRSRITAERIKYDSLQNWHLEQYVRRDFDGMRESIQLGSRLDTIIPITPEELFISIQQAQQMTNPELREWIKKQNKRGASNTQAFESEWHKRFASPVGVFIMTLLAVTMSFRKVRGGMGKNLGIGITLSALYILFSTVSTTFAVSGVMTPFMAVWFPNIVFLIIGIILYRKVSRS